MKIKEVTKAERKKKTITIRTYLSYCKFMAENKISPTKVFNLAVAELIKEKK